MCGASSLEEMHPVHMTRHVLGSNTNTLLCFPPSWKPFGGMPCSIETPQFHPFRLFLFLLLNFFDVFQAGPEDRGGRVSASHAVLEHSSGKREIYIERGKVTN